jgi:hypothetical protein
MILLRLYLVGIGVILALDAAVHVELITDPGMCRIVDRMAQAVLPLAAAAFIWFAVIFKVSTTPGPTEPHVDSAIDSKDDSYP